SIDDTPGLEDTVTAHRERNTTIVQNYSKTYYPEVSCASISDYGHDVRGKTYPNVIFLVASWDSIKEDDNDPHDFTSSIGKTIYHLQRSGLHDDRHQNII